MKTRGKSTTASETNKKKITKGSFLRLIRENYPSRTAGEEIFSHFKETRKTPHRKKSKEKSKNSLKDAKEEIKFAKFIRMKRRNSNVIYPLYSAREFLFSVLRILRGTIFRHVKQLIGKSNRKNNKQNNKHKISHV